MSQYKTYVVYFHVNFHFVKNIHVVGYFSSEEA